MTLNTPRSLDRLMCGVCRHLGTLGSPRQVLSHRQEQDAGACEGDGKVLFSSVKATLMAQHSSAQHMNGICWQYTITAKLSRWGPVKKVLRSFFLMTNMTLRIPQPIGPTHSWLFAIGDFKFQTAGEHYANKP